MPKNSSFTYGLHGCPDVAHLQSVSPTYALLISQHQLNLAKPYLCPRIQVSRTFYTVVLMWLICSLLCCKFNYGSQGSFWKWTYVLDASTVGSSIRGGLLVLLDSFTLGDETQESTFEVRQVQPQPLSWEFWLEIFKRRYQSKVVNVGFANLLAISSSSFHQCLGSPSTAGKW